MTELEQLQKTIEDAQQKLDKLVKEEKEKSEEVTPKLCEKGTTIWSAGDESSSSLRDNTLTQRGRIFSTEDQAKFVDELLTPLYKLYNYILSVDPEWRGKEEENLTLILDLEKGKGVLLEFDAKPSHCSFYTLSVSKETLEIIMKAYRVGDLDL